MIKKSKDVKEKRIVDAKEDCDGAATGTAGAD